MVLLLGGWKFWLCDPIVTCSSKLEGMGSGNCFKNAYLLENSAEITFPFPFTACICLRESLQHLYSTQITSPTLLFALHVSGALYLFTHNLRLMTFLYNEASRGFVLATRISLSDNINSLFKFVNCVNPKWWKMTGFLHHRLPHSLLHFPHSTTRLTRTLS